MQKNAASHAHDSVLPQVGSKVGKKEQVAEMFDGIAGKYDFLNHTLSLGIDKVWRKMAIQSLTAIAPQKILDVATGTGDFAIAALRLKPTQVIGIDISDGMLKVGREKIKKLGVDNIITLQNADSEKLPFANDNFDAITCGYGVRNFEHLNAGLQEMSRVLRPGGRLVILEFSRPTSFPIKQLFQFYFKNILPAIGNRISKSQRAYNYLQESSNAFPYGQAFCDILQACGFKNVVARPLAFGITTLYIGTK